MKREILSEWKITTQTTEVELFRAQKVSSNSITLINSGRWFAWNRKSSTRARECWIAYKKFLHNQIKNIFGISYLYWNFPGWINKTVGECLERSHQGDQPCYELWWFLWYFSTIIYQFKSLNTKIWNLITWNSWHLSPSKSNDREKLFRKFQT
jgi:hypothetical protein